MKCVAALLIFAAVLGSALTVSPSASADVSVEVSVRAGPPPLPYYPQPWCPGPGYVWTPGYWAYADDGYFWVPGTWVLAPVGLLWTPGWWGWREGFYVWHPGYWGPHVGFYGGINYGYGYTGIGFIGGYWRGDAFYYNRAVTSVNVSYVHNTYVQAAPAVAASAVSRVSYNGGEGGVAAKPTAEEQAYAQEQHRAPLEKQMQHERSAMSAPAQRYSVNKGMPETAVTARPNRFTGNGAVRMNPNGNGYDYARPALPRMRPDRLFRPQPQPMMHRGNGDKHPPPRFGRS